LSSQRPGETIKWIGLLQRRRAGGKNTLHTRWPSLVIYREWIASVATQEAKVEVTIANELGLHARPAMTLVDTANQYTSDICVKKGDQSVDAKSIMQVMMLAATQGTALEITAEGEDAEQAIAALKTLIENKFDEA
jgi:phosphocarrier protein